MYKGKAKIRPEGEIKIAKDKVEFIGLGAMGKPMARNLVESGIETVVYDVRKEPIEELEKIGAKVAHSAKEMLTVRVQNQGERRNTIKAG